MRQVTDAEPTFVDIRLWDRSALVLMNWLLTHNERSLPYDHPAQKQALRDLLTALEWTRGLGFSERELADAQERVAKNMSDEDRAV